MASADHGGAAPDLYQVLGVPREASREEIVLAWRRRAREEHPDARPADAGAAARFGALAAAWQVLGDPGRRAAYDRSLARGRQRPAAPAAPVRVPVRHVRGPGSGHPLAGEPPLRAGPVRVECPFSAPPVAGQGEDEIMLAIVAEIAARYLGRLW